MLFIEQNIITVPLYKFLISIEFTTPITFNNFPGITLRGAFGWMLKQQTCLEKDNKNCRTCQFVQHCPYASIFETPNVDANNPEIMKKATNFPHPFVLSPIATWPMTFDTGSTCLIHLSIFGEAIKYFHFFVRALIAAGNRGIGFQRGKFIVKSIINYTNNEVLFTHEDGYIANDIQPLAICNENINEITINFLTPCEIKSNGMVERQPDLNSIIKNILRRYKIISYIYGGKEVILNEGNYSDIEVVNVQTQWNDIDRLSRRQNRKMKLVGFTGSMQIKGNLQTVYPILKIGEIIHIGKHTSFGCGLIQITK